MLVISLVFLQPCTILGPPVPRPLHLTPPPDTPCSRAINWAKLAKKEKREKKLAITVFSFPPDKGNVGE